MINISERKRGRCGNDSKPSQMVTWLKCQICGEFLPPVPWSELLYRKRDLCEKHKNCKVSINRNKVDIMACVKKGAAYWSPTAVPPQCKEKGATNCTIDCPFEECIVGSDGLYL